jgi:hypothetical protein
VGARFLQIVVIVHFDSLINFYILIITNSIQNHNGEFTGENHRAAAMIGYANIFWFSFFFPIPGKSQLAVQLRKNTIS